MATPTDYYGLTKPASTENYNLAVWNRNLEMIDTQMHQNETETFTGATELADGTVGNVPAPLMADREKFLKGDGTWAEVQGGGGSSVIPNPTGTPTDTLDTISIDGTIYEIQGSGGSTIVVVERTDSTNSYAWLIPKDANGNILKPSEVTILSIFAEADMSGAPPYYNGLNVCVDTDGDRYSCKLYNTQTGVYVADGTYQVTYRVAYIPYNGGQNEN